MIPPRIKDIKVLDNYNIEIYYINGEKRIYNMEKNLEFKFYNNLKNISYFKLAKSAETTIEWPQGEDIDPNELYENSIVID
ncbi:MAG: DUF2442 domain-containing protein [Clostridia bacterium]|nr:DUF2442 domain-containing protein [Clostridia bacterium]